MKRCLLMGGILAGALNSNPARAQAQATITPGLITQEEALTLAQAAIQACKAQGMSVNVQVVDADGRLRIALASENATLAGLVTAPQKAASVLAFRTSTRELQARLASNPEFAARYGKDPRYHFSPGGLPLYREKKFVAALAVGGGRNIDERCAIEALKSLPWASTEE